MKKTSKQRRIRKLKIRVKKLLRFLTYDIWRVTEDEVSGLRNSLFNIVKTIILSIRFFLNDRLSEKASALTYNTLLAIVPVLALLLAVSKGFGFQSIIENQLLEFFPGQKEIIIKAFGFVSNYLQEAKNGLFLGIGLIFLLWAVISLIGNIETVFNYIWQVKSSRSFFRKFTDYLSMVLIIPILMILSSGMSIFISTSIKLPYFQFILDPLMVTIFKIAPYVVTCLLFTVIYIIIPNTRVKFINAFWAGLVAGTAFTLFQYFYINGQIWVAKYNAIYGSFAALPLLLLWVQLSWLICLYGAELAYASQNVKNFNFEQDTNNISRRYYDFITILIATLVVKRFEKQLPPLTNEELSTNYRIPSKLTSQILGKLCDIGILCEVVNNNEKIHAWQPAMDIHKISVGLIMSRMDAYGSEDFKIDRDFLFSKEWEILLKTREEQMNTANSTLLIDLQA
ncbi:MAG: YihY/virulence factor BrkB family protein [Bacteroidales bacterium]|nr:YihY/virulence factor BrkB family protein [Bacteroidales bacterium]